MSTELNQKALERAKRLFFGPTSTFEDGIKAYLKACDEPAEPEPFDLSKVKPGDEVYVQGGGKAPYKFIGLTSDGRGIVIENKVGGVDRWSASSVTIPPKPRKTVRVKVFNHPESIRPIIVHEDVWGNYAEAAGWKAISKAVEIEVTE